jgi:hypothetical protein
METPEKDRPPGLISEDEHLRLFLLDRNVACPLCGYNLRCQSGARCPECGRELRLTVGLTEPYLRAWIGLAFATFGTGGIGLAIWLGILMHGWLPTHSILNTLALLFFLASPFLAAATIIWRRRFIRLPTGNQWWIALVTGALSIGAYIVAVTTT